MTDTAGQKLATDVANSVRDVLPDTRVDIVASASLPEAWAVQISTIGGISFQFYGEAGLWHSVRSAAVDSPRATEIGLDASISKVLMGILKEFLVCWRDDQVHTHTKVNSVTVSELVSDIWVNRDFTLETLSADKAYAYIIDATIGMHGETSDESSFAKSIATTLGRGI